MSEILDKQQWQRKRAAKLQRANPQCAEVPLPVSHPPERRNFRSQK
jgi:hypothetical protein